MCLCGAGKWRHNKNKTVGDVTSAHGGGRYKRETVASTDAGAFLSALHAHSDFVSLKLDIEGFEYQLLPHLMMHAPRALCGLGVMAAEWHESMVPKYTGTTTHLNWFLTHAECNVTVIDWH